MSAVDSATRSTFIDETVDPLGYRIRYLMCEMLRGRETQYIPLSAQELSLKVPQSN